MGEKRLGGNDHGDLGAKRLGEKIVWGRNDPDSLQQPINDVHVNNWLLPIHDYHVNSKQ